MDTLLRYKRPAVYLLFGIVMLVALVFQFTRPKHTTDFAQAPVALSEGSIRELQAILSRHHELEAKYDGPIAQYLLKTGDPETATLYADRVLERTGAYVKAYANFAETSLMIGMRNYSAALDRALDLKEQLGDESLLKLYNLLRIAVLQQELGNQAEEREAWRELIDELGKPTASHQSFLDAFRLGDVSLMEYATSRTEIDPKL